MDAVKPASPVLNTGHPLANGLIRAWTLHEGTGSQWADLSGQNKPVVVANHDEGSWISTAYGPAYQFNGTDQHGAAEGHQLTTYTHAVLVIPNTTDDHPVMTIAEEPGATKTDRLILARNGKWEHYLYDGGFKVATSTTGVASGSGVVLGATSDGSNMGIWVNGVREANPAAGAAHTGYTTPEMVFARGKHAIGGSIVVYSNPTIVGAYVWSRVLDSSEMAALAADFWAMFRGSALLLRLQTEGLFVGSAGV